MKKLLTTLSILILLIGATILTNSTKVHAESNTESMKLTSIQQTQDSNKTLLTFTDLNGDNWQCYGNESTDKLGLIYNVTMQDNELIDYKQTNIVEGIMVIDNIYYNDINHSYDAIVLDEHDNNTATAYEIVLLNANKEDTNITSKLNDILKNKSVHVKIDTKGTINNLTDDIVLEYNFTNN